MEKEIICTVCPMGCHITVTGEGDRVDSITGYTCKRGEEYGKQESYRYRNSCFRSGI